MAELVGIAKLAAAAPVLQEKRLVSYSELTTRSFLAKCDSPRMPFRWIVNPYRGCEFGCKYCYARYTHEFMEMRDPQEFERRIFVKQFDAIRFRQELSKLPRGETIAFGSATDPYQPAERKYGITRALLQEFTKNSGFCIGLITKSDLIVRDIDVYREIARRHRLSLVFTITTLDADLARLLEPLAPRPDLRLDAMTQLAKAGLVVSVNCSPILPLINDSEESIDAVAHACAQAGASRFGANVVFLKPCSKDVFISFLAEHFPHLERRYRERFERDAFLRGDYPEKIRERVMRVKQRRGFIHKAEPADPELWHQQEQLSLFS